jgi:putative SOS response-associated peptidase YedK
MREKLGKPLTSEGEVRPTDIVPAIASAPSGTAKVYPMLWGFSARGADRPIVNARVETAPRKPLWKEAWAKHRCIIPASWYFEWEHLISNDGKKKTGPKYLIQPKDSAVTWMCGLYRIEEGLPVFVILTRAPGEEIRFIHDRMPLILPEQYVGEWIKPETRPEELVKEAQTEMYFEKA